MSASSSFRGCFFTVSVAVRTNLSVIGGWLLFIPGELRNVQDPQISNAVSCRYDPELKPGDLQRHES
jgi:hypothetical protein